MTAKNLNDLRHFLCKTQKYHTLDGAPELDEESKEFFARQIAWIDALTDEERRDLKKWKSRAAWQQLIERVGTPPLGRAWMFKSLEFMRSLDDFDGGGNASWLE